MEELFTKKWWIFQANPERFRILDAFADPECNWDNWRVTRYKNEIKNGHFVFIWVAGKNAGIYAIGEITSDPFYTDKYNPAAEKYFGRGELGKKEKEESKNKKKKKVTIANRKIVSPLYKEDLKEIAVAKRGRDQLWGEEGPNS